jgi:hypothetical protein
VRSLAKKESAVPRFPKTDKRLLGTWKSDRRRTFAEWNWKKNTSPKRRARLQSLFGKLEVTYTRTKVFCHLPDRNPFKFDLRKWETCQRYAVLGVDETTVAIVQFGELEIKDSAKCWPERLWLVKEFASRPQIKVIHFEKKHYWISLGNGRNREFFKRIHQGK